MSTPITLFTTDGGPNGDDPGATPTDGIDIAQDGQVVYSKTWSGQNAASYSLTVITDSADMDGSFLLFCTDKPNPNEDNDDDWVQDEDFDPTNPGGAGPVKFMDKNSGGSAWRKRLKYTNSTGVGIIYAYVSVQKLA